MKVSSSTTPQTVRHALQSFPELHYCLLIIH